MSDDLVKRARCCANGLGCTKTDKGDFGIFDDLADRIEELEAQLAKAMEALDRLDHLTAKDAAIVVSTLSELKGKANE